LLQDGHFQLPVEAVDLLYKTLKRLTNNGKRPVIAIVVITILIELTRQIRLHENVNSIWQSHVKIPKMIIENGFEITQSENGFLEIN
jgi:exonuclease SbcD